MEYFGKLKGPLYFNRINKLKAKLNDLENATEQKAEPTPVAAPTPAPVAAAAPVTDSWGAPAAATPAPAVDSWGSPAATETAPASSGFGDEPASSGFGGGFGDEPEEEKVDEDTYGFRASTKTDGRAECFMYKRNKTCVRGDACKFLHAGAETKGSRGEYSYDAEINQFKKGPCNDFAEGGCSRGASCIFIHDKSFVRPRCGDFFRGECTRDPCRFSHDPNAPEAERSNKCFAFERGECEEGDDCRFAHPGVHEGKPREPREPREGGGGGECYAFQKGECTRGADCRFSHGDEGGAAGGDFGDAPAANEWGAPAAADEWGSAPAAAAAPAADSWGAAPAAAPVVQVSEADFFSAVEEGNVDVVAQALKANKDLANKANEDGETALFFVTDTKVAELLLKNEANVNYVSEETGETALFAISEPSLVGLFAQYGADLDVKNIDGVTAAEVFAEDDNQAMIDAITAAKANPPAPPAAAVATPIPPPTAEPIDFFNLVETDNLAAIQSALNTNKALANQANDDGETPLFFASSYPVAELLLKNGADANYVSEETGETALFAISEPSLVALFVANGAVLDVKNADGQTASDVFAEDDNTEMVAAIEAATPKVDLVALVESDDIKKVTAALAKNKDLANTASEDGDYPLSLVTSVEMANLLLDNGADLSAKNEEGETPLFGISLPDLVAVFVAKGADVNATNAEGETALDYAVQDENEEMAAALRAAGGVSKADEGEEAEEASAEPAAAAEETTE